MPALIVNLEQRSLLYADVTPIPLFSKINCAYSIQYFDWSLDPLANSRSKTIKKVCISRCPNQTPCQYVQLHYVN